MGISSLLFLVAELLRPSIVSLAEDPLNFAAAVSSPAFVLSQLLFLPILALLSCAAISVYKLLSTSRDNRPAFWAMVSCVIGIGLFLPSFGVNAFILPVAGQLYIHGDAGVFEVYLAALRQPWAAILLQGGYLLVLGLTIFNIVVWRSGNLPKWAATLYWIGWTVCILSGNQLPKIGLAFVGVLVAVGGGGLARGVWRQAPIQLQPASESIPAPAPMQA